jgi:hypothetical protein
MSEKPSKPRRDLRARLGKTITPKGAESAPDGDTAAPVAGAAASTAVTPPAAVKAPAGGPSGGIAAPPAGLGATPFAASPDVAPPPFARANEPHTPADPFAATAAAPAQQVVRLEFDDKLVTDQEVGKTALTRIVVMSIVLLLVGGGLGYAAGQFLERHKLWDRTVRDAQSIYRSIDEASSTVQRAQTLMNAVATAAAGDATTGTAPRVDYESIQQLQALQKPFDVSQFLGKNYNAFAPETVHDLFMYTQNVERIWNELRLLAAESLSEARRAELARTAQAVGERASTRYGAVLMRNENGEVLGQLAFLEVQEQEGGTPRVLARPTRGGQGREFQIYTGSQQLTTSPQFVLQIDGAGSAGVLAEQTGAFGRLLVRIRDLKQLIDQTVEIQGRLLQAISNALTEAGASASASH